MRVVRVVCVAVAAVVLVTGSAEGQVPWPGLPTPLLPPDPTVPYLPAVKPVKCISGRPACVRQLAAELRRRTNALGCSHDAVFSDAYVTITRAIGTAAGTPGFFDRPDRVRHEARTYAQAYLDQFDRWHAGKRRSVSPSWQIAFRAARRQSVTALGDLMLALNAHIRRDKQTLPVDEVVQFIGDAMADLCLIRPIEERCSRGKEDRADLNVAM